MSEWKQLKKEFYGSNTCAITQWGTIDFSPESKDEVVKFKAGKTLLKNLQVKYSSKADLLATLESQDNQ